MTIEINIIITFVLLSLSLLLLSLFIGGALKNCGHECLQFYIWLLPQVFFFFSSGRMTVPCPPPHDTTPGREVNNRLTGWAFAHATH